MKDLDNIKQEELETLLKTLKEKGRFYVSKDDAGDDIVYWCDVELIIEQTAQAVEKATRERDIEVVEKNIASYEMTMGDEWRGREKEAKRIAQALRKLE